MRSPYVKCRHWRDPHRYLRPIERKVLIRLRILRKKDFFILPAYETGNEYEFLPIPTREISDIFEDHSVTIERFSGIIQLPLLVAHAQHGLKSERTEGPVHDGVTPLQGIMDILEIFPDQISVRSPKCEGAAVRQELSALEQRHEGIVECAFIRGDGL